MGTNIYRDADRVRRQDHELEQQQQQATISKNKAHRKDKPWDTDAIDKWAEEPFKKEDHPLPFAEESSFATLFPKYRERYLQEAWPSVSEALDKVGIAAELDLLEGSMLVKTTRRTFDPYAILNARDVIKLLARSVPISQAARVLEDGVACDVVKIGNMVSNKDRFVRRRQRLIGPNGSTLKALELLTNCFIMVQGRTVSVIGSFKGLKIVRRIVEDCINNIHPIYHIKELMIKRELEKDPNLANESWDRFLPNFRKRHGKRKALKTESKQKQKGEKPLFPPAQTPRKVDLALESGEFFLKQAERAHKVAEQRDAEQKRKRIAQDVERAKDFEPPEEAGDGRKKKTKI